MRKKILFIERQGRHLRKTVYLFGYLADSSVGYEMTVGW